MKDIMTPVPPDEVRAVIKKCLENAALINYNKLASEAKVEGKIWCWYLIWADRLMLSYYWPCFFIMIGTETTVQGNYSISLLASSLPTTRLARNKTLWLVLFFICLLANRWLEWRTARRSTHEETRGSHPSGWIMCRPSSTEWGALRWGNVVYFSLYSIRLTVLKGKTGIKGESKTRAKIHLYLVILRDPVYWW